jgi:hypothetical protein
MVFEIEEEPIEETQSPQEGNFVIEDEKPVSEPSFLENYFNTKQSIRESEYQAQKTFGKGLVRGATLGYVNRYKPYQAEEGEEAALWPGEIAGEGLPALPIFAASSYLLPAVYGLSTLGTIATGATAGAITGGALEAGKEYIQKGELKPGEIAKHAAIGAATDLGFQALIYGVRSLARWLKSLTPSQQKQFVINKTIPPGMDPIEYSYWENEVTPKMQEFAKQKYEQAYQTSKAEAERIYQNKLANVKAEHENDLLAIQERNSRQPEVDSERAYQQKLENVKAQHENEQLANNEYNRKLEQIEAEHKDLIQQIEQENTKAQKTFQEAEENFKKQKTRNDLVQNAITPEETTAESLTGRVSNNIVDRNIRPQAPFQTPTPLQSSVGEIFHTHAYTDPIMAGRINVKAIRANDSYDYGEVQKAYRESDRLNSNVITEHPSLGQELVKTRDDLMKIPHRSPPQETELTVINKLLKAMAELDESGNVLFYKPIESKVLSEQAKVLRYYQDFDFAHGNPKGLYSRTTNQIENAVENASISFDNGTGVAASRKARQLRRIWENEYQNDVVRPFRNTSNEAYESLFNKTLSPEDYLVVDRVLSKSNAGQLVSNANKRALVENKLSKYFKEPSRYKLPEFKNDLDKLSSVINNEERQQIEQAFIEYNKTSHIPAKKVSPLEQPKQPKLKEVPKLEPKPRREINEVKLPAKEKPAPSSKEITQVKLPTKEEPKITPEMRIASKMMGITPEQAMAKMNTITGVREIKKILPKGNFETASHYKMKNILSNGKAHIEGTGYELGDRVNANYDLVAELIGKEETETLLKDLNKIGKSEARLKKTGDLIFKSSVLKFLLSHGLF